MKKNLLTLILTAFFLSGFSQKNDNVMILGYHYFPNGPIPIWDFTYGYPDTAGYFSPIDLFECNSSICDSSGVMQLYTNGITLINRYQQIVPGSTDFNADTYTATYNPSYLGLPQAVLILPSPGFQNKYSLFHMSGEIIGNYLQPTHLGYSEVDMTQNNGQGQMIIKDQAISNLTFLYSTLNAVRHANGRDWWVIAEEFGTGLFFQMRSLRMVYKHFQGLAVIRNTFRFRGESCFSPDGEKFAVAYPDSNKLILYTFDRCTGDLTFEDVVSKPSNFIRLSLYRMLILAK
ncbi:MAG: hypothetical protein U0X76_08955 [Bacteroidia bacterium]